MWRTAEAGDYCQPGIGGNCKYYVSRALCTWELRGCSSSLHAATLLLIGRSSLATQTETHRLLLSHKPRVTS